MFTTLLLILLLIFTIYVFILIVTVLLFILFDCFEPIHQRIVNVGVKIGGIYGILFILTLLTGLILKL